MTSGHHGSHDGVTSSDLLTVVSNQLHTRRTAEIGEWQAIVAWAENNLHDGSSERHVDDVVAALDAGIQLAGPDTPAVSEFALMELTAVLERSPESGRFHVARILECAWRLRQVYEAVCERRLAPHKAARIAEHTLQLSPRPLLSSTGSCSTPTASPGPSWTDSSTKRSPASTARPPKQSASKRTRSSASR